MAVVQGAAVGDRAPRGAMGQATITLNGRTYRLRCGDGEEPRLLALAAHVRDKIERLASEFGQVGDDRLMVMAALLVTDELFDARAKIAENQSDPSLFEPLPEYPEAPRTAEPVVAAVAAPMPPLSSPSPAPVGQGDGSLKRALKRPVARQTLDERLAEARDNPLTPERVPPRKTG